MASPTTEPTEVSQASSLRVAVAPAWWPALAVAAGIGLLLAGIAFATYGKPLAEKTITALAMPVGGIWLLATGRLVQMLALGRLRDSAATVALWLVLSICGTRPLQSTLTHWLESSVTSYQPSRDGDLDALVVLGGGTTNGPWRAQAGSAGDRVLMAAQLYHQGHARQLITTGEATPGVSKTMISPADQTVEIWTGLGIPRANIMTLGGQNTAAEMANLKSIWEELEGKRVGLLTSALHLPRAMRLARAQGLELVPVAANVKWSPEPFGLLDFIPQAGNFADLAAAQHELMAYLVRR